MATPNEKRHFANSACADSDRNRQKSKTSDYKQHDFPIHRIDNNGQGKPIGANPLPDLFMPKDRLEAIRNYQDSLRKQEVAQQLEKPELPSEIANRAQKPKIANTKPNTRKLDKEKVCSKLAEVLFDVLQKDRPDADWNISDSSAEDSDSDSDSSISSSIAVVSDDEDVSNYPLLSQMSCGLSQNLSQRATFSPLEDDDDDLPTIPKKPTNQYLKIGLFWDIENCPVPKGKSVLYFVKKLRDTFFEGYTQDKFIVVCNALVQSPAVTKDLRDVGVSIEHVSPGKNAADEILRRSIREFSESKIPGTKVVLITGDIDFSPEICEMRYKRHFEVILIHNKGTKEALKICANQCISFEEFASDLPTRESTPNPVSVTVLNLPTRIDVKKLKIHLGQLVDPFGGNVLHIPIPVKQAVVKFSTESDANRAISFLQNEDVFGSRIKLSLTKSSKDPEEEITLESGQEEVASGGTRRKEQNVDFGVLTTEDEAVLVTAMNLPKVKDDIKIKFRLNQLVNSFGGQVLSISPPPKEALIRFLSRSSAYSALQSLQDQDVFGWKLRLVMSDSGSGSGSGNRAAGIQQNPQSGQTSVSVVNLPQRIDVKRIKFCLGRMMTPLGGHVLHIPLPPRKATVEFSSKVTANRAIKSLQGADLLGSKIRLYLNEPDVSSTEDIDIGKSVGNATNEPVSIPKTITFCIDRKVALAELRAILNAEIEVYENLSVVSSKDNKHCYSLICPSLSRARKAAKQLISIRYPKLYDVQIIRGAMGEDDAVQEAPSIKRFDSAESAKDYYLAEHEAKYGRLKLRLDALIAGDAFQSSNTLLNDELKMIYNKLRLMDSIKDEFINASKTILHKSNQHARLLDEMLIECEYFNKALPIYIYRNNITASVGRNQITVIASNPGSGKSTQVVQYIRQMLPESKSQILCVQPHVQLAYFVLGQMSKSIAAESTVCHTLHIRDPKKRVFFVTDRTLLNECFLNPLLNGYSHIIIDEVQLKSPATEVILAYLRLMSQTRKDLRLVVLCTLDVSQHMANYLNNAPVIEIDTKCYPVEKIEINTKIEDYIIDYVNKIISIANSEETAGNVLVFLPNIPVVNQTAQLLAGDAKIQSEVKVFKLLLEMDFHKTYKEIERSRSRCIILTTSELETVVCMNNVKLVLDSGLVTHYSTGPFSNSVETVHPNDESTDYQCMKCDNVGKLYRFKFSDMPSDNSVRRSKSTELLVLSVFQLAMKPVVFSFLYPLEHNEILSATKALENMKAINDYGITEKGSKMLVLPLDIHLASLLIDGAEKGIGFVTLCFCAIASTSQIHKYLSDGSNGLNNDNLLELLGKYLEEGQPPRDNMDCEIRNIIDVQVVELESVLKSAKYAFNIDTKCKVPSDWMIRLQKLIGWSWRENICGLKNRKYLYESRSNKKLVGLLPHSRSNGKSLQSIAYETLWKFGAMEYAVNFIPMDFEVADNVKNQVQLSKDVILIKPLGSHIMRSVFIGNKGQLKTEWEHKLSNIKSKVRLFYNTREGELKVNCKLEVKPRVLNEINKAITSARASLANELWEFEMCKDSGMKIVWGKSAEVLQLLMPKEFLKIVVFAPSSEPTGGIIDYFGRYGRIIHDSEKADVKRDSAKQVVLMYNNPKSAQMALSDKNKRYSLKAMMDKTCQDKLPPFTVLKMCWARRLNCGTGVVTVNRYLSSDVFHRTIARKWNTCFASAFLDYEVEDKRILFRGLRRTMTKVEFEEGVEELFGGLDLKFCFHLTHEQSFISNKDEVDLNGAKLRSLIIPIVGDGVIISVRKPEDKDELWFANIIISNVAVSQDAINSVRKLAIDDCPVCISETKYCNVYYTEELFSYHKNAFVNEISQENSFKQDKSNYLHVSNEIASNDRRVIKFEASKVEDINRLYHILTSKFSATRIDLAFYAFPEGFSFEDAGLVEEFAKVSNKWNAFIKYKKYANEIVVVGSSQAVRDVQTILQSKDDLFLTMKTLKYCCDEPGMLCKLIEKFGSDLKDFQTSVGAVHIVLDIYSKTLVIWGGNERKIMHELGLVKSNLQNMNTERPSSELCPICSDDPLEHETSYRMDYCGHIYCYPCISAVILNMEIPVGCIVQGCNAPIVYRDLRNLQRICPLIIRDLASRAIVDYIRKNPRNVFFCPVPDCDGVFPFYASDDQCLKCYNKLCLQCDVVYHYGQTCEEFRKTQKLNKCKPEAGSQNTTHPGGLRQQFGGREYVDQNMKTDSHKSYPLPNTHRPAKPVRRFRQQQYAEDVDQYIKTDSYKSYPQPNRHRPAKPVRQVRQQEYEEDEEERSGCKIM